MTVCEIVRRGVCFTVPCGGRHERREASDAVPERDTSRPDAQLAQDIIGVCPRLP